MTHLHNEPSSVAFNRSHLHSSRHEARYGDPVPSNGFAGLNRVLLDNLASVSDEDASFETFPGCMVVLFILCVSTLFRGNICKYIAII